MSLPTWALYMKKVYADSTLNVSREDFIRPENVTIETDCNKLILDELGDPISEESEEEF
jgi:penicillin-binding protein 1A